MIHGGGSPLGEADIAGGRLTRIILRGRLAGGLPRKTEHVREVFAELASAGNAAVCRNVRRRSRLVGC